MSITFNHTIIHVLDLSMGMPILSTDLLVLNDETESFITKHLVKVFESSATCEAVFKEESAFRKVFEAPLTADNFLGLSNDLADIYFRYMTEYGTIPSGDLIITYFTMDGSNYLGVLKLNYKEEYTHFVENSEAGVSARIIKHKGIFPPTSKQVDEGIIINMETEDVMLLDATKSKYLSLLYDLEPKMSVKETIMAIEKVASKVIEEHYENPLNAITELKTNISESISRTSSIPVQEIMEQTFGEDVEVFETCMEHMEEMGIKETKVEISDPKIGNKFSSQKLKTDTGIELKFPTHLFKDSDFIEIINEPDGTFSIVLKHISQIINK